MEAVEHVAADHQTATRDWPRMALLAAVAVAVHLPFLSGGWMTDDFVHIEYLQRQTLATVFASPDVFGYYRPLAQASLLANLLTAGPHPLVFRLTNLALEVASLWAAFLLGCTLLGRGESAFLATLAFALTPKAHTIAVQWTSARPELLMAIFSLLAVSSWIRWDRGEGRRWCGAASSASARHAARHPGASGGCLSRA